MTFRELYADRLRLPRVLLQRDAELRGAREEAAGLRERLRGLLATRDALAALQCTLQRHAGAAAAAAAVA